MKRCSKCLVTKDEKEFHLSKRYGLQHRCKWCQKKANYEWKMNNKERFKEIRVKYERKRTRTLDVRRLYSVYCRSKDDVQKFHRDYTDRASADKMFDSAIIGGRWYEVKMIVTTRTELKRATTIA